MTRYDSNLQTYTTFLLLYNRNLLLGTSKNKEKQFNIDNRRRNVGQQI